MISIPTDVLSITSNWADLSSDRLFPQFRGTFEKMHLKEKANWSKSSGWLFL